MRRWLWVAWGCCGYPVVFVSGEFTCHSDRWYISDRKFGKKGGPDRWHVVFLVEAISMETGFCSFLGTEDAHNDSQAIRGFVGIDFARESAPDAQPSQVPLHVGREGTDRFHL